MAKALVTGGAGFVGRRLCERLLAGGDAVVCVDNLSTSLAGNVERLLGEPGSGLFESFEFFEADVSGRGWVSAASGGFGDFGKLGGFDEVYHLASPASPADFERRAVEILEAGSSGTRNALDLARGEGARFLLASTSEVYGDPLVHPQHEEYLGNVDPVGVRGAYDEAKRFAEALTSAYHRRYGLGTRIARIFNTYGPGMREDDGRMIPNFVRQALAGEPLTVYGGGLQTRSVQYVDDLVEGLVRLMRGGESRPVNLGNPEEHTVKEIAETVASFSGSGGGITYLPLPQGDPKRRCPDISRARASLGWEPRVPMREGLRLTLKARRDLAVNDGSYRGEG